MAAVRKGDVPIGPEEVGSAQRTGDDLRVEPGFRSVPRDRLVEDLLRLRAETVVYVSGAAGAGKSTLARQWAAAENREHALIRLSTTMNDPVVLAAALVSALETVGAAAPRTRSNVTAEEPTFSALLLPALTALASSRDRDYVLLLDDLHLLSDRGCQRLIRAVADGIPGGSTLGLLSRSRAPDWLARGRANGLLHELDNTDLAFDVAEAATLFSEMGISVPDHEIARAVEDVDGWAVGLYLSALHLRANDTAVIAPKIPLQRGSDRSVRDYIRLEVLDPLDEESRDFLLHASVLEDLHPAICDTVLQRSDSAALLTELSDQIQLIVVLDAETQHYRLHHLLSEVLVSDLERRDAASIADLHRRAAAWYRADDDLDTAIRHARASHDLGLVGSLVWAGVPGCLGAGQAAPLRLWLDGLTDNQIASDPWLTLSAAWLAVESGHIDRFIRWLLVAESHAGPGWRDRVGTTDYVAQFTTLRVLSGVEDSAASLRMSEEALVGLSPDSPIRAPLAFLNGVLLTLNGQLDAGRARLQSACRLARALGVPTAEAHALTYLGLLAILRDDTTDGIRLIDEATALVRGFDVNDTTTLAHCVTAQAFAEALTHQSKAASATLVTARRLTSSVAGVAPWFAVSGPLVQARTAVLLGDGAVARQLINEARAHLTPDLASTLLSGLLADTENSLRLLSVDGVSAAALTTAEIRVMQFLPSHLTYPQIGEHLFLSSNTVKTHALSIYRKLGVASRSDAVARARALGFIESPPLE